MRIPSILSLLPTILALSLLITCQTPPQSDNEARPLTDRGRDGLAGPVKAVLTDDVILVEESGQWFESQQASSVSIYDETGMRILQTPFRVSLPGGYAYTQHESFFDPQMRGREVEEKIQNTPDKWVKVYDDKGYLISRTRLDSNGNPAEKNQITYEYDSRGNWVRRKVARSIAGPAEASYRQIVYFDSRAEPQLKLPGGQQLKSPLVVTEGNINTGRLLFNQKCIACHGENGKAQTEFSSAMIYKPKDLASPDVRALSQGDIYSIISDGVKPQAVHAFRGRISDEALWRIALYVTQLSSRQNTMVASTSASPSPRTTASAPSVAERRYPFKGRIVSIEREMQQVTVEHEEIPGYMGAMTMPFPVRDLKTLDTLKKGDRIQATLVVDNKGWRLENMVVKE